MAKKQRYGVKYFESKFNSIVKGVNNYDLWHPGKQTIEFRWKVQLLNDHYQFSITQGFAHRDIICKWIVKRKCIA